jgi:hypothetical protein
MSKFIVDPPSGWKYGFPKEVPKEVFESEKFKEWLIEQGYPEKDVDFAVKYSRYWKEEEDV